MPPATKHALATLTAQPSFWSLFMPLATKHALATLTVQHSFLGCSCLWRPNMLWRPQRFNLHSGNCSCLWRPTLFLRPQRFNLYSGNAHASGEQTCFGDLNGSTFNLGNFMPPATKHAVATLTVQPSFWECACSLLLKGGCRSCFEDAVVCSATWCSGLRVGSSSKGFAFAFSVGHRANELGADPCRCMTLGVLRRWCRGLGRRVRCEAK